jgi:uncharacterized protein YjbI with pentapeptide repeats
LVTILFISANPRKEGKPLLDIAQERTDIYTTLRGTDNRDQFPYPINWDGIKGGDLLTTFDDFKPEIVHFSGHATKVEGLPVFLSKNDHNKGEIVAKDPFIQSFELFKDVIKCVILNACYSEEQAKQIARYIPFVIGMSDKVDDREAKVFSSYFYKAIGNGNDIKRAFDIAKTQLGNEKMNSDIPQMCSREENKLYLYPVPESEQRKYVQSLISQLDGIFKITDGKVGFVFLDMMNPYIQNRRGMQKKTMHEKWSSEIGEILDLNNIVESFLQDDNRTYLFVVSPFGMGKSLFMKQLALEMAKKCMINMDKNAYIPFYIPLELGLDNFYQERSLSEILDKITHSNKNEKVLIMLDGLDSYSGDFIELNRKLRNDFTNYSFRKIIITTRPKSNLPEIFKINNYIELLPFTNEDILNYLSMSHVETNYYDLVDFGLDPQEISRPLFLWMIKQVFSKTSLGPTFFKEKMRFDLTDKFSKNAFKTCVYMVLLHSLLSTKDTGTDLLDSDLHNLDDQQKVIKKKKILREIVQLRLIYGEKLNTLLDSESELLDPNIIEQDHLQVIKSIIYSIRQSPYSGTTEFILKAFDKYLSAENYLECIIKSRKPYLMNSEIPNKETIDFLEGLVDLIKDKHVEGKIKLMMNNSISLFNSIDLDTKENNAVKTIISNSIEYINDNKISLLPSPPKSNQTESNLAINSYENLWINRWIALFILNTITSDINEKKVRNVANLIVQTSGFIPQYLKKLTSLDLSLTDLQGIYLPRSKLSGSDFSGCNMYNAVLNRSDLSNTSFGGANLSNSNLSHSIVSNSYLKNTDLLNANLISSNISKSNLKAANLLNANLHKVEFYSADLSDAIMMNTNLSGAILYDTNLSNADLSYANLSGAILYDTNLSNADLSYANMSGCLIVGKKISYQNLDCTNLICRETTITNSGLLQYLNQNGVQILPSTLNKNALIRFLERRISNSDLVQKIAQDI